MGGDNKFPIPHPNTHCMCQVTSRRRTGTWFRGHVVGCISLQYQSGQVLDQTCDCGAVTHESKLFSTCRRFCMVQCMPVIGLQTGYR